MNSIYTRQILILYKTSYRLISCDHKVFYQFLTRSLFTYLYIYRMTTIIYNYLRFLNIKFNIYLDIDGVIKVADVAGVKDAVITIEPIYFVAAYGQYDRTFQKRIDMIVNTAPATTGGEAGTRKEIF